MTTRYEKRFLNDPDYGYEPYTETEYFTPEELESGSYWDKPQGPQFNPATQGRPPTVPTTIPTGFDPGISVSGEGGRAAPAERPSQPYTIPSRQTGSTATTQWIPSGPAPTMGKIPEFEAPEWDEEEIARIRQVRAAPGIRRLRGAVQQAMGGAYESPQIKRMTLRQALAGYGMGLESVMSGAGREARGEYMEKHGREFTGEQMEWQAEAQRISQMYSGAMQAWARSGKQVSTQKIQYGGQNKDNKSNIPDWWLAKPKMG